ncbi:hypothetical protein FRC10_009112 [Ceratobasidium sp. 414]|nr:hypothetical protein FRC10_009112 [Ceratobasidium sp. 414]
MFAGIEMDIRDLKFEDESFDVLIDKGTMDAMLTGTSDVWNPAPEIVENCEKEISEAIRWVDCLICALGRTIQGRTPVSRRVLRPGGKFIYLTFGQPHFRRRYLTRPGCSLEVRELGEAFHYYLYVMTKVE